MKKNVVNPNVGLYFILAGVIVLLGTVLFSVLPFSKTSLAQDWKLLVDEKDGISVEAQPIKLSHDENSVFKITFTTHQGSLDFDPAKISVLQDNNGKKILPIKWDGSPAGGHHRTGTLIFPKIDGDAMEVSLLIAVNKSERKFEWSLH